MQIHELFDQGKTQPGSVKVVGVGAAEERFVQERQFLGGNADAFVSTTI